MCIGKSQKNKNIEEANFTMDASRIPDNPFPYNEIDSRKFLRLVEIEKHLKMDKYDKVEKVTYSKPKPESGESTCFRVKCPYWFSEVICWKCI